MIKFKKKEDIKFVGHLDILRTMQRIIKRAELKVKYSQGFNQHPIISVANPLMLGATSDSEYIDIEFEDDEDITKIVERMNENTVPGLEFLAIKEIEKKENSTGFIHYADYVLSVPKEFDFNKEDYLSQEEIVVTKKTKKGEREFNIKELIYDIKSYSEDDRLVIEARLRSGTVDNVKPALFMKSIYSFYGKEFENYRLRIHRKELLDENFNKII